MRTKQKWKATLKKTFLRERCWHCGEYAPMFHEGVGGGGRGGTAMSWRDAGEWASHKLRCERNFSYNMFYDERFSRQGDYRFGLEPDEKPQRRLT